MLRDSASVHSCLARGVSVKHGKFARGFGGGIFFRGPLLSDPNAVPRAYKAGDAATPAEHAAYNLLRTPDLPTLTISGSASISDCLAEVICARASVPSSPAPTCLQECRDALCSQVPAVLAKRGAEAAMCTAVGRPC